MIWHAEPRAAPSLIAKATLRSEDLEVTLLPDKGADIYSIVDRASEIDVLFKTPWGLRHPSYLPPGADSEQSWLARYPGGWQQLLPNAGPARRRHGVMQGYHGEAAVVPWTVDQYSPDSIGLSVELTTTPLALRRELRLDGPVIRIRDSVSNLSPVPVPVAWVQHPAFGAPFLDASCRLTCGASGVVSDAQNPGALVPGTSSRFPHAPAQAGGTVDLRAIPGPGSPRAAFAALTGFETGWFALTNPALGFGVGLGWDATVLPHAWFWQECRGTADYPWFRRAYAVAVEPANVLPGEGSASGRVPRDPAPVLAAEDSWSLDLSFVRFPATDRVSGISPTGEISTIPAVTGDPD